MISVIVIEKNEEKTIRRTLDSLLKQTYADFEIIIVDGYSTDNTQKIIKQEYSSHLINGRIKLVLEPGLGFAHARNVGIEHSSGDILAFTGGNECADPSWLENVVKSFSSAYIGGVYGRMEVLDANVSTSLLKKFCGFKRRVEFSNVNTQHNFYGRGTNMAFRKSVIQEIGWFDESLCDADDTEFAWRVGKKYRLVYNSSAIVYHLRGEWITWRAFLKYLWKPIQGHAQAVRKNGLFKYYPLTTIVYLSPVLCSSLLLFIVVIGQTGLFLASVCAVLLGLSIKVIKDAIKFRNVIALFGLVITPVQLIVGSTALLTGFTKQTSLSTISDSENQS